MRALLDESLPRRLARAFPGIEVETVFDRGWQGLKNGVLLGKATLDFDVFITADQNLRYQQNLAGFEIGVVVLAAVSNRLEDLLPLLGAALEECQQVRPGEVRVVASQGPGPSELSMIMRSPRRASRPRHWSPAPGLRTICSERSVAPRRARLEGDLGSMA